MTQMTKTLPIRQSSDYARLAKLWSAVLKTDIDARQVALCIHQMHISTLIDHPDQLDMIVPMAESLFQYEALTQEKRA